MTRRPMNCIDSFYKFNFSSNYSQYIFIYQKKTSYQIKKRLMQGTQTRSMLQFVFVRHRASFVVCKQFNNFKLLKHYKASSHFFLVKHFNKKRNQNCNIHGSTTPGLPQAGKIYKKATFSKIFFSISTHMGKKSIHCNDVHEVLYQNCENHSPCVRGSGPSLGPIWPYSKTYIKP